MKILLARWSLLRCTPFLPVGLEQILLCCVLGALLGFSVKVQTWDRVKGSAAARSKDFISLAQFTNEIEYCLGEYNVRCRKPESKPPSKRSTSVR